MAAFDWQGVHPVLSAWFQMTFGQPTDVQMSVWRQFDPDEHVLIAAPTGSGKTLAALLPGLDAIVKAKSAASTDELGTFGYGVRLLYVTPLKALNNDIHHHVVQFAEAMERMAADRGLSWPGLRV